MLIDTTPRACLAGGMVRVVARLAVLGIRTAAMAQPCHPGPRLFETDRAAYEAQARRVFAATASLTPSTAITNWTTACRAVSRSATTTVTTIFGRNSAPRR